MLEGLLLKFIKFGLVGFVGVIIDFGTTYLLKERLKWNKFLANSIGFTLAVINNYLLNRYWVFESRSTQYAGGFALFLAVSIMGLLLNNGIIFLLNERYRQPFYVAKAVSLVIVAFWNFFMNYLVTFG